MNDETRQMRERLFDHIVLGIALIALVAGLSTWVMGGVSSPWFIRSVALLIVALVAFGLRRVSQLVVATYVLVLELIGLVAAVLIQANTVSFIPYLFIPIIVIGGLNLSPVVTIIIALLAVLTILTIVALTQPLSWSVLIALLPPLSLIILAAFLVIEGKRYVENLGERLLESRKMLRERTLEMMEAQTKITELQSRAEELKQQLLTRQSEAHQAQQIAQQKSQGLYELIKGSIQELDITVESLEHLIDQIDEEPSPDEQASLLEAVWQKIYHLNNLVINLEDIAQLKNNRITLNYQPVDIPHLLQEVVSTARGLARGKNVEIRYQAPENLPQIQLDPARIRQALLYVLNNAVKYTDQGIIEVQAELNSKELLLFVSDTGIGMHREEMELVFQEFSRGSGTLAKQRQGTGLGLAISKALVELHGGHMWVTSVLGVGSTFYINLPLEPPAQKIPAAVAVPVAQPPITAIPIAEPPAMMAIVNEEKMSRSTEPVVPAKPSFGPPVGRYSPTYIGRFSFILLTMLLIIASAVALLAVIYGPVNENIAQSETASPTSIAELPVAVATETAASLAPLPTNTPTTTASPTATNVPATSTNTPPASPTPVPTNTPEPPTPTQTSSPVPPTSTSTSTPTQQPPSPTVAPSASPTPVQTKPPSGEIIVQPASTHRSATGLSFAANQALAWQPLSGTTSAALKETGIVADGGISWSPDGQRVLFVSARDGNHEIYVANADGSNVVNLTHSNGYDSQPAWSPDGRGIAFSSQRDGNVDIFIMDANGGNLRQLTTDRGFDEWPAWSPDGRQIAFVSDQDGNNEIYTIKIDGSDQQRITNNKADDWPVAWSPDGRYLVFGSNRDGNWNLYVVNATGGEPSQLTNDPADEREPAWSPDGRAIAFASNAGGNWNIYTLPAPVGAVSIVPRSQWSRITNTPAVNERFPVWVP